MLLLLVHIPLLSTGDVWLEFGEERRKKKCKNSPRSGTCLLLLVSEGRSGASEPHTWVGILVAVHCPVLHILLAYLLALFRVASPELLVIV